MSKKSRKHGSSSNSSKQSNAQGERATKMALAIAALNFGTALMKCWQDNHDAIVQFFHMLFRLKYIGCRSRWMSRHLLKPAA
jgi:hypothetical protein